MDERTALYRAFDMYGRLLYVGISWSPLARLDAHRSKGWWAEVDHITIRRYPTRLAAKTAETAAIKSERPVHNIAEDDRTVEQREREQSFWGLLCHLEPRLEEIEGLVADFPDTEIDASVKRLVGWARHPTERSWVDDAAVLREGIEEWLDIAESQAGETLIPADDLLGSQAAYDFVLMWLRYVASLSVRRPRWAEEIDGPDREDDGWDG